MYCANCGSENAITAKICENCGVNLAQNQSSGHIQNNNDRPNLGVNLLSLCCIPILGIILFFVWKDDKPAAAKSALIFGLCGFGLIVLAYVLLAVFGIATTTFNQ